MFGEKLSDEAFVALLKATVVEENAAAYRHIYATDPAKATDPYFKRSLALFNSLSADQQAVFLETLRQVSVDTVSSILSIIDGSSALPGAEKAGFSLRQHPGGDFGNDLQSEFLRLIEDDS